VTRVQPERVRTVEIGYRLTDSETLPGGRSWASAHGGDGVKREVEESVLITGDGNLLEVQGSILYTIDNPRVYLLEVAEPEHALRPPREAPRGEMAVPTHMRERRTAGGGKSQQREQQHTRDGATPKHLGIDLKQAALPALPPPLEVVQAYHEVTRAMEHRKK